MSAWRITVDILTDDDVWNPAADDGALCDLSVALQVVIGFGLALLINRQFRSHSFWTTIILLPMMLSPAVVGNFWTLAVPAADRAVQLRDRLVHRHSAELIQHDRRGRAGALDHRARRYLDVGAVRDADLPCRSSLDSRITSTKRPRSTAPRPGGNSGRSRLPMVMPFLMLAVLFRAIENFKMFDMVNLLTSGGPGSTTEVVSITLKRAAFEKWQTGYSSALAIILFVTVFGAANIYVKVLNRVKQR